jgi:hypothetical protein
MEKAALILCIVFRKRAMRPHFILLMGFNRNGGTACFSDCFMRVFLTLAIACPNGLGQGNRRYQIAKSTCMDFPPPNCRGQPTEVGFAPLLVQFQLLKKMG